MKICQNESVFLAGKFWNNFHTKIACPLSVFLKTFHKLDLKFCVLNKPVNFNEPKVIFWIFLFKNMVPYYNVTLIKNDGIWKIFSKFTHKLWMFYEKF